MCAHTASTPVRRTGIVLVVGIGILQLHPPHYLTEHPGIGGYAAYPGPLLVATALAAVSAAMAIHRNRRWGWQLGIGVAAVAGLLYVAQETVGLPGLPQTWWEPTRLLSLLLCALFVVLARRRLR
jgi:peptidoglycan/LPS O-acetylase OafA/YrhL